MKKQSILAHDLIEAQILSNGRTTLYSPFEERLIFPIKDALEDIVDLVAVYLKIMTPDPNITTLEKMIILSRDRYCLILIKQKKEVIP